MTSGKQISLFTEDKSTYLAEGSPASLTAQPENDLEKKMTATSGRRCLGRFEKLNQATLWAKTFAGCLVGMEGWFSMRCSLTWKLRGTKSSRFYFQLAPSTLPTEETEFGLLPTPQAIDGNGKGREMRLKKELCNRDPEQLGSWRGDLKDWAFTGMLPTPQAADKGIQDDKEQCTEQPTQGVPDWWSFPTQPPICGGDDGLPTELDGITVSRHRRESIKAYGNAIVPQVAYQIFKAIEQSKH
jgi:hypothetical protein